MTIAGPDPTWTAIATADQQLNSVAISDDGRFIVTGTSREYGSGRFSTFAWDALAPAAPLWSRPVGSGEEQHGVFWVTMSGSGRFCASGGSLGEDTGFFAAYEVASGAEFFPPQTTRGRVSQIEMSGDGFDMVAVAGDQLFMVHTGALETLTLSGTSLYTCAISRDGEWVLVGSDGGDSGGSVHLFRNDAGTLTSAGTWAAPSGVLRVAISDDGAWLASSRRDGVVTLARASGDVWAYASPTYGRTYALSLATPGGGGPVLAVGANRTDHGDAAAYGDVYVLDSDTSESGDLAPTVRWTRTLEFAPNPGIHMDGEGRFVTAVDGEPLGKTGSDGPHPQRGSETPGNFYLFDAGTGAPIWTRPTALMNWGMAINRAGTAIAGGSDSGVLYYWGAPAGA